MNCVICWQPEIAEGFASIAFERDEAKLVVNSVPVHICRNCGETYLNENITLQLLRITEETMAEGVYQGVYDYARLLDKK